MSTLYYQDIESFTNKEWVLTKQRSTIPEKIRNGLIKFYVYSMPTIEFYDDNDDMILCISYGNPDGHPMFSIVLPDGNYSDKVTVIMDCDKLLTEEQYFQFSLLENTSILDYETYRACVNFGKLFYDIMADTYEELHKLL